MVSVVEHCESLPGHDSVSDVDEPLCDLSGNPKAEIAFEAGADSPHKAALLRQLFEFDCPGQDRAGLLRRLLSSRVLAGGQSAGEEQRTGETDESFTTMRAHDASYRRASDRRDGRASGSTLTRSVGGL